MNIVFFGSFQHYSALILQSLIACPAAKLCGVVTTPPAPMGRKQILTKNPVHLLAEAHSIPVYTPSKLEASMLSNNARSRTPPRRQGVEDVDLRHALPKIPQPDIFLTAGYGKILPQSWLDYPKLGSLNLHFSLLPKYRGANPAEWAIMCGETETGITLMKMNQKLDGGDILAQAQIPILETDNRETLYQKLYQLGADMLPQWLVRCRDMFLATQISEGTRVEPKIYPEPQKQPEKSNTPYAALLKRDDGFLPWSTLQEALRGLSSQVIHNLSPHLQKALKYCQNHEARGTKHEFLTRLPRALAGYPSLWTIVPTTKGDKRMKILSFKWNQESRITIYEVQLEGQKPAIFNQIRNIIIND